ncbi:sensor histidine kinase [Luteibacter yeojuensis]|uniref:Histidine kinase/HSP90-like ATPase domain-containing protein n=1 Tax=Luteibacter yeojuensis TaxID=345309 RepID=A0A0F3KNF5_9GAMM|nr:sensor histidine kinase [Luteibacter yeojuensis]KJV32517.1 hypothetical protein VI08_12335 [Luteibacter yeojuensis]
MFKRIVPGIAFAMACAVGVAPATPIGLFQLQHSVVQPGGEPLGQILSMAQDSDGFLWLTTHNGGLLRFDGQQAVAPYAGPLASFPAPMAILLGPRGESRDMWVGHRRNGITHIVDGVVTHYEGGAFPPGTAFAIKRDRAGIVWAMTTGGVARFVDGAWQGLPSSFGWAKPHPENMVIDAATGDVYVQDAEQGALVSRGGQAPFKAVPRTELDHAAAGLPAGVPWTLSQEDDGQARMTSDGALWFSPTEGIDRFTWADGPVRGTPAVHEHMSYADGLSGGQVMDVLEDREGNVWLATDKGLDRFRRPHFTPLVFDRPLGRPIITPMPDGSLWITSNRRPPLRYAEGRLTAMDALGDGISSVTPMADGSVLVAGLGGVRRWHGGAVQAVAVPAALAHVGTRFKQVIEDGGGGWWVTAATFGLYHVEHGAWTRVNGTAGFPDETPALMRRLPDATIGFAYGSGRFLAYANGRAHAIPGMAEVGVGAPLAWLIEPDGMWVGGTHGLARIAHGAAHAVRAAGGTPYRDVSGIARDTAGAVWLYHHDGVDRIGGGSPVHIAVGEGIGENPAGAYTPSSLMVDAAGKVWVAGGDAVAWIDPAHVVLNTVRPSVKVDALVADQAVRAAAAGEVIPALTRTLRIDYTAPMLRWPERSRFEYQLSGVDEGWQQADTRRSAYYTNLAPGRYAFRVRAFNEDGVGSAQDTVYHFRIAPAWYQTYTFLACVGLLAIAAAWLAYRYRVRALTRRLRIRMDERERIARDLHDTLLQGFQGLVLRFQAIERHVADAKVKAMIDKALTRADAALVEGRETVALLRDSAEAQGSRNLAAALAGIGVERADLSAASFRVTAHGRPRELAADVFTNAVAIAREAVLNALQHAAAPSVAIEVGYGRRTFSLRIVDNGRGFDPAAERHGHWGLLGMRERARAAGGALVIEAVAGGGTAVSFRCKAPRAYL